MACCKLLTARRIVTGAIWACFILSHLASLRLSKARVDDYAALALAVLALLLAIASSAALVIRYRRFFGQWRGAILLLSLIHI